MVQSLVRRHQGAGAERERGRSCIETCMFPRMCLMQLYCPGTSTPVLEFPSWIPDAALENTLCLAQIMERIAF